MTKKPGKRFGYLAPPTNADSPNQPESEIGTSTLDETLQTVPKGEGRMAQDRTQLNIRIPTLLKRRAGARAMLEGRTLAEVVEEFLQGYTSESQ